MAAGFNADGGRIELVGCGVLMAAAVVELRRRELPAFGVGQIHRPFRHWREVVENTLYIGEAIDDIMGKGHSKFLLVYGA
jgi:hypothetical protein